MIWYEKMALQRQGSGSWQVGIAPALNGEHKLVGSQRPSPGHSRMYDGGARSDQGGLLRPGINSRNPLRFVRGRRLTHSGGRSLPCSTGSLVVLCFIVVLITIFSSEAISHALIGQFCFCFYYEMKCGCGGMKCVQIEHCEMK